MKDASIAALDHQQGSKSAPATDLLFRVAKVSPRSSAVALAKHLLDRPTPYTVAFLNQHGLTLGVRDSEFAAALHDSDLILRDGSALKFLLDRHRRPAGVNMNGTDFIPLLLSEACGSRVAFYGTRQPWIAKAASRGRSLYALSDVDHLDGFRDYGEYLERARQHRPSVIVLGMGMPKQETIARRLKADLDFRCLIVSGGAFLDFLADRFPRAPKWMRNCGLEWIFRLWLEPRRLSQRYLLGGLVFLRYFLVPARQSRS